LVIKYFIKKKILKNKIKYFTGNKKKTSGLLNLLTGYRFKLAKKS